MIASKQGSPGKSVDRVYLPSVYFRRHVSKDVTQTPDVMKIRLTKRFAQMINGVDLTRVRAGDVLDLSPRDAGILLAEGWALPVESSEVDSLSANESPIRAEADDRSRTRH